MKEYLQKCKLIFEKQLEDTLQKYKSEIQPIYDALCYAVSNGGKRIRPALCYLGAEFCGKDEEYVKDMAVGIEMVHSYSLVHDDLPCMDDDELRRGKPTVHVAFGEGMAVLVGDALLNLAFEVMLQSDDFDSNSLKAVRYIAKYAGMSGMIGGQCLDLANENNINIGIRELSEINRLKTSCLLKAALLSGAAKCGATDQELADLGAYADKLGEIFQMVDDILDRTSTEEELGKQVNQDSANGKTSVVDIFGIKEDKKYIDKFQSEAMEKLAKYGSRAAKLCELCKFLSDRSN